MQKKLFIFDCDGTLLDDNRNILPETITTLKKAIKQGHEVALCTGRNFHQVKQYLELIPEISYVASMNGASVTKVSNEETFLMSNPLPIEIVNDLVSLAQKYKREFHWCNHNQFYRVYFGSDPKMDITDMSFFNIGTPNPQYDNWCDVKQYLNIPILHMAMKIESSLIDEPYKYMFDKYAQPNICSVVKTGDVYIDVNALNVNKYRAVQKIQALTNVTNDNTYCFGDSDNDISMLINAGHGICVNNATSNALKIAKHIIASNNEPGISQFIEKVLREI